jgi:hypothetical protein
MKIQIGFIFLFLTSSILFSNIIDAQNKGILISTRISLQSDFQIAEFRSIPPDTTTKHSTTTINWGIDLLIGKYITNNLRSYISFGYYRNKFNFKRGYDHQLLNIGTDSLAIGTRTYNYTYHLFRLPIGITYKLKEIKNYTFSIGMENIFNFSFKQVYNGGKPFPNANNKYSNFQYYGNSVILIFCVSQKNFKTSFLELDPYVRVSNIYRRKDKFLYETNDQPYSRFFDAIGLSLEYSFNLKKQKT